MARIDGDDNGTHAVAHKSELLAVGLWDDFTVRLFNLDDSLEEALLKADQAMYQAKQQGRNRVVMHNANAEQDLPMADRPAVDYNRHGSCRDGRRYRGHGQS